MSTAQAIATRTFTLRPARPADVEACGRICYEAFTALNRHHNFPPDFPSPEMGVGLIGLLFSHPRFFCVVAEIEGKLVGSNCLDERSRISGVGPITVSPSAQDSGVGRALMEAVLQRASQTGAAGVRLVQAAFHNRSHVLYTKLGFEVREPLAVLQGPALNLKFPGCAVRPATAGDVSACDQLCLQVHGHERGNEMQDAIAQGIATVVERDGQITGYAAGVGFFCHAVGATNLDLQALIGAAPQFLGPGFLLPTRNFALYRWCLEHGLKVVEPMTLMSLGLYNQPHGAFLPSITF